MTRRRRGQLVIIGGREDKDGDPAILAEFVRLAGGSDARIVVMTVATQSPEEVGAEYTAAFNGLGVADVRVVDVSSREQARAPEALEAIERATGTFFSGGDQLRITSLLGGTPIDRLLHECYDNGMVLAGTSSGASMMSCTMIVTGNGETHPSMEAVELSPGMKFIEGPIIDQHFAQRGRIGRLLSAVAYQPAKLGLGVDENTALVVEDGHFRVLGQGTVTVIDARDVSYTNLQGVRGEEGVALFGVRLHVLPAGYRFDLDRRLPIAAEESSRPER